MVRGATLYISCPPRDTLARVRAASRRASWSSTVLPEAELAANPPAEPPLSMPPLLMLDIVFPPLTFEADEPELLFIVLALSGAKIGAPPAVPFRKPPGGMIAPLVATPAVLPVPTGAPEPAWVPDDVWASDCPPELAKPLRLDCVSDASRPVTPPDEAPAAVPEEVWPGEVPLEVAELALELLPVVSAVVGVVDDSTKVEEPSRLVVRVELVPFAESIASVERSVRVESVKVDEPSELVTRVVVVPAPVLLVLVLTSVDVALVGPVAVGALARTARSPVLVLCVVTTLAPLVVLVVVGLPLEIEAVEPLVPVALATVARGAEAARFWAEAVAAPRARTTETAM